MPIEFAYWLVTYTENNKFVALELTGTITRSTRSNIVQQKIHQKQGELIGSLQMWSVRLSIKYRHVRPS